MISGKTKVCGLIGYPVAHSMSPFIHGRLAELMEQDLAYVTFPVEPGKVGEAIRGAGALGIGGLNVTVPHKEAVIPFLSVLDPVAEKVGAVNTLVPVGDGTYKGYNTDITGLDRALETNGIEPEGKNVLIIGAGGGARSAAVLNAEKKAHHIYIMNRSPERAAQLSARINKMYGRDISSALSPDGAKGLPKEKMIVFQATSVGLFPDTDKSPTMDEEVLSRAGTVFDLIYTPSVTKFMRLSEERGAKAYNGLWMLLWQAVSAFELWTGVSVEKEKAKVIYNDLQKEMGR